MSSLTEKYPAAERFIDWLAFRVESDARGDGQTELKVDPRGLYWLGRLAPEMEIINSNLGDRAERLEPCAVGLKLKPKSCSKSVSIKGVARFSIWKKQRLENWRKLDQVAVPFNFTVALEVGNSIRHKDQFDGIIKSIEPSGCMAASIDTEVSKAANHDIEISISLVNISDIDHPDAKSFARARLFECSLEVEDIGSEPFMLETLPDSFRYDRRVAAWGINCGVANNGGVFKTIDLPIFEKMRPTFWNVDQVEPDFSFKSLAKDPIPSSKLLLDAHKIWGEEAWDIENLRAGVDDWTTQMTEEVQKERKFFLEENKQIADGISLLEENPELRRAFCLMNEAMHISTKGKYDSWRPFQVGFLLANIKSCLGGSAEIVDIVWFSTGGGKTETYLGLILTAAFFDRMRGKTTGTTAWSRFPLRLLSLQQTQRFANALAAAEIIRSKEAIGGDTFSLGFLVGNGATPNKISDSSSRQERGQWDYDDLDMPKRVQMLKICPFCRKDSIEMKFNRRVWRIEHRCKNSGCVWGPKKALPIWVVDTDIWRYLPTIIVGTLDKAAGVSMQASMRGLFASPRGMCPEEDHGHTYSPRSGRRNGCLVPGCEAKPIALPMPNDYYGLTYRLQDEVHLLRDSLGAVDAHYEALLDHLQEKMSGRLPKILASSATLNGYDRQSSVLYSRDARVFPHPEPKNGKGFWAGETNDCMRRFLAVSPRGQTIEYALDRMIVSLQSAIREMTSEPEATAQKIGISKDLIPWLVRYYGTNVVYGNTLRDLDAVVRSSETQWGDIPDPPTNVVTLTGRSVFADVCEVLENLEDPSKDFSKQIHVVAASSMMSHGVDIDCLNILIMMGLPLTTAEFMQASARIGRQWPSLAFVVHKIGRERDASIFRSFPQYVDQGDRFVEPIPITGRSRRVLERTMPGLVFARILMFHEQHAEKTIWKAYGLREYIRSVPNFTQEEVAAICDMLGYSGEATASLKADVETWFEHYIRNINDPANAREWANKLGYPAEGPMRSLRDVEEQVPIWGSDPS